MNTESSMQEGGHFSPALSLCDLKQLTAPLNLLICKNGRRKRNGFILFQLITKKDRFFSRIHLWVQIIRHT